MDRQGVNGICRAVFFQACNSPTVIRHLLRIS
jgi:hypothetical protein